MGVHKTCKKPRIRVTAFSGETRCSRRKSHRNCPRPRLDAIFRVARPEVFSPKASAIFRIGTTEQIQSATHRRFLTGPAPDSGNERRNGVVRTLGLSAGLNDSFGDVGLIAPKTMQHAIRNAALAIAKTTHGPDGLLPVCRRSLQRRRCTKSKLLAWAARRLPLWPLVRATALRRGSFEPCIPLVSLGGHVSSTPFLGPSLDPASQ